MLFCDCFNKLIVYRITVPGSHECPDYRAAHYYAQTAQFALKMKYCGFYQVGKFKRADRSGRNFGTRCFSMRTNFS